LLLCLATTTQPGVAAFRALINKQHNQASRVALCLSFDQNMPRAPHARGAGSGAPEGKIWDPRPPPSKMSPKQGPPNEGLDPEAGWARARAHTATPRPVPGLCSCALKARPSLSALLAHSSAKPKCACKAVDIYSFASLSGLQSRHELHRQLLQHAVTEASTCTAAYAQLVDE
jgi:hypothetical protein